MNDLTTIFLGTKDHQVFTIQFHGNPDEPCVCLFTTKEAASKFRKQVKPFANKNFPVDLRERSMSYLLDL